MFLSSVAATICHLSQAMTSEEGCTTSTEMPSLGQSTAMYPSIFSYLHRAVRSRIPGLPSLRRSNSAPNLQELATADTRVPPLASREAQPSLQITRTRQSRPLSEASVSSASGCEGLGSARASTAPERASGVDWFTAETGLLLVNRAYAQAARSEEMMIASLVRSQHIHGLTYLLQALPNDLGPVEVRQLQNALPDELQAEWRPSSPGRANGNLLSRGITFVMLQCAIFLSLLLPILMRLSNRFLQYEREHHIVQNLFASTGQAIESVGEQGLDLKDAIVRFSQRRVGSALFGGLTWVAEGVVQGISEGAGRSAVIVVSAVATRSDELQR